MKMTQTQARSINPPLPSAEDPLCAAIEQAQSDHALFAPGSTVVTGVSGGADSICLLHLLWRYAQPWCLTLHVAHLDHALRPESSEDAAFVAQMAETWGLPFHHRRLQIGQLAASGENLEAAARQIRYGFLAEVARAVTPAMDRAVIAVAHTANDQAETLLLHLLRGSGLAGLAGMRPRQPLSIPGGAGEEDTPPAPWLVRPLLDVQRTQILRYLATHNLPWREDPTNRDLNLTRNWLRHEILPRLARHNPVIQSSLARTAVILAAEADRADEVNRLAFAQIAAPNQEFEDRVILDLAAFLGLDVATQRGVLRCAWANLPVPAEALTFAHIEKLRRDLSHRRGHAGPFPLAAGIAWTLIGDRFSLHRQDALPIIPDHPFLDQRWRSERLPIPGEVGHGDWVLRATVMGIESLPADWRRNPDPWQIYLDRAQVGAPSLATPQPGQRIAPLGMEGSRKSLGDLFTDRKIPPSLRAGWPLIVNEGDGEILWVCGIQPVHRARITAQTEQILHLRWERSQSQ
ncbi:MAG: tRNA lysidine(34) synthetase TilS [Caldilineaceae bacterium]|nr:tRNA lysidine(34) synthetase TilS [Caldilineaceae bacterium]